MHDCNCIPLSACREGWPKAGVSRGSLSKAEAGLCAEGPDKSRSDFVRGDCIRLFTPFDLGAYPY
jgi:hypothetical protein